MTDLTSRYKNEKLRDAAIQACVNSIDVNAEYFPDNYYRGSFTDFFDIQGGTQPPKSQFIFNYAKGYARFLQIRDFSSDSTPTFIPINSKNKLCEEDDILLGRYGASVGKILTGKSGAYNVACAKILILNQKMIDSDYLFYLLHSPSIQNIIRNISRSAQGGFNKGDLAKINIVIPKSKWQKKILFILKSIDDFLINQAPFNLGSYEDPYLSSLIRLFNKQLGVIKEIEQLEKELTNQQTLLQHLRHGILQEAVQGKLTKRDPTDEPARKILQCIKAEKLKLTAAGKLKTEKELPPIGKDEIPFELPEGWEWCRLSDISYVGNGSTPDKSDFTNNPSDIPYLKVYNIVDQMVNFNYKPQYIKASIHYGQLKRSITNAGNVLMNIVGPPLGKVAIVPEEIRECNINQAIVVIKPFLSELNKWIYWYLREESAIKAIVTRGMAGQDNISVNQSRNLVLPVPPLYEQRRIISKVEQLMNQLEKLEYQVEQSQEKSRQLLQAVLKEAFLNKGIEYDEKKTVTSTAE